jgi:hypothetical protein
MHTRLRPLLPLIFAICAVGCGNGLAGNHYRPPYATIHGTITASDVTVPTPDVRVALGWLAVQPGQGAFQVTQSVSVKAQFPTKFDLDVTDLPPPQAVSGFFTDEWRYQAIAGGLDPTMRWAQAVVLVYEDDNGNGQLDLAPPGQKSPDRVLGKAEGVEVFFLQSGRPAPADYVWSFPTAPGFSIAGARLQDPAPGDCGAATASGVVEYPCGQAIVDQQRLSFPTNIQVALTADPHLQGYACTNFWSSDEWPDFASDWNKFSPLAAQLCSGPGCDCVGSNCALDLPPAGVTATCNADGTAYVYKTCVDDPDVCGTRFCHYGHGERAPGIAPPTGWPCP